MCLHGETYLPNGLSFQRASSVKIQVSVFSTYIISMKWILFSLWNMWKYAHFALTTITQLYLTFVTFLKYYQVVYIINSVISSRFKCYRCTYVKYWMFMNKEKIITNKFPELFCRVFPCEVTHYHGRCHISTQNI